MSYVFPLLKTFQLLSITIKVKAQSLQYLHPHLFSSVSFYSPRSFCSSYFARCSSSPNPYPPSSICTSPTYRHHELLSFLQVLTQMTFSVRLPVQNYLKLHQPSPQHFFFYFYFFGTDHYLTFSLSCLLSVVPKLIPPRI